MQLVKVILHGSLKGKYPEMEIGADCAADAIEGWSRQCGFADLPIDKRPVIQVMGHDSKDDLFEHKELSEIHVVPAMFGGGGIAKIAIGTVLVVAGILLIPVIGPMWGGMIISTGAGLIIGGVMELFMKAPSISKSKDPEASKYIGGGANTTAIGTPIGFGGGRMKIGGQFLSVQVNAIDIVYGTFPATP